MTIKRGAPKRAVDSYLDLVRQFPLRPIRSAAQHQAAMRFLIATSMQDQQTKDHGVLDYMETLAKLIEEYEKKSRFGADFATLTPVSALNHLMEVHGLNVSNMAAILGTSQGTLSDIRKGQRRTGLSKRMIRRLVDRFGVDAHIFL